MAKAIFVRVLISVIGGGLIGFVLDGIMFVESPLGSSHGMHRWIDFNANMDDFTILFIIIGGVCGIIVGACSTKKSYNMNVR